MALLRLTALLHPLQRELHTLAWHLVRQKRQLRVPLWESDNAFSYGCCHLLAMWYATQGLSLGPKPWGPRKLLADPQTRLQLCQPQVCKPSQALRLRTHYRTGTAAHHDSSLHNIWQMHIHLCPRL